MHVTPSILGEGVPPWGRCIQISPVWAPIGCFWGIRGTKSRKRGPIVLRKPLIAFRLSDLWGLRSPKRDHTGPIARAIFALMPSPTWEYRNADTGSRAGMPVPGRPLAIGTLTRHRTSPDSPTWELQVYPVERRWQVPDPSHSGDEITKTGAYCFRKTPNCLPIAGFVVFSRPKKGPNGPNCAGENSPHGLPDDKRGNPGSGDPGRNVPGFPGTGGEQEENPKDRKGGIRL